MSTTDRKIVVLGGEGFLGKHVMTELRKRGLSAVTRSRRTECDITNMPQLKQMLSDERPDVVVNCAAHVGSVQYAIKNAATMLHDNMQIIINLYKAVLEECPQTKIVNPISNCSYPGDANIHSEPDYWNGKVHDSVAAYGNPRRMIFVLSDCYKWQHGLKSVDWIIANAYGPGDYLDPNKVHALNGIIIRLMKAQKQREKEFEIWGSGKPTREWVYIEDVARILADSLDVDEQTEPLNFAQNKAYSIAEIAAIAAEHLDYQVRFKFNLNYADGAPFKILDDKKFRTKYPEFRFTPLDVGIANTINYYKDIL